MGDEPKTDGTLTVFDEIVQISDDVFCVNGKFRSAPGLTFPCRSTIIRLPGNKLIIYSPFNPSLVDLSSLGTVHALIVPNMVHLSYAHAWKDLHPDATMYSSPSAKLRYPDRDWGTVVEDDTPISLGPGVKLVCISHLKPFQEILLLYEPTKSLLMADFGFNLTDHALEVSPSSTRWYVWLVNGTKKLGIGHVLESMIRSYCKESLPQVDKLVAMDWEAVIPCHGDIIDAGGKEAFREHMYEFIKFNAERRFPWKTVVYIALFAVAFKAIHYMYGKKAG